MKPDFHDDIDCKGALLVIRGTRPRLSRNLEKTWRSRAPIRMAGAFRAAVEEASKLPLHAVLAEPDLPGRQAEAGRRFPDRPGLHPAQVKNLVAARGGLAAEL